MVNPIKIWPRTGSTTVCTPPNFGNSKMFPVRNTTPQMPPIQIHAGSFSNCAKGICSPCPVTSNNADRNNNPTRNDTRAALKGEPTFFRNLVFTLVCMGKPTPARNPRIMGILLILRRRNVVRGRVLAIGYGYAEVDISSIAHPHRNASILTMGCFPTMSFGALLSFFIAILSTFKNNFLQHATSCFLMRPSCAKI